MALVAGIALHYRLLPIVSVHLPSRPKRLQNSRFLLPRGELQFHIARLPSLHFLLGGPDVILMLARVQLYVQLSIRAHLSIHQKVELADQLLGPTEEEVAFTNLWSNAGGSESSLLP